MQHGVSLSPARRLPLILAIADLLVVWLMLRQGLLWPALLWLALHLGLQILRWRLMCVATGGAGEGARAAFDRLAWLAPLLGLSRALPVALLFPREAPVEQMALTVIYLGHASGVVATAVGRWRAYLSWAIPSMGSLALAWVWVGGPDGWLIAALICMLVALLTRYVRDHGQILAAMAGLAADNQQLADSLRAERQHVAAASRRQARVFTATGHDLRQPLHAIQTNVLALQLLAAQGGDERVRQIGAAILRSTDHAQALLDDVLDLSRLETGALQPSWQVVDLAALLQCTRGEFEALAAARGLWLRDEAADLGPLPVRADAAMLRRILHNLVANAIKYTREGGVTLQAAAAADGRMALAVVDTGPGIAAEEQALVFDEFVRGAAGVASQERGLGLGLAIVRRMADLLGAELSLDSAPGRGTKVQLLLAPASPAVT